MTCIDSNCAARCLAADSVYLYWVDEGSANLHQGRVENGGLQVKAILDRNCQARLMAGNDRWLYWVDEGATRLYRGRAANSTLVDVELIDENCRARVLACDNAYLYWVDEGETRLHQGRIQDGRLVSKVVLDDHCTARLLAANDEFLYWIDPDSDRLHRGVARNNRLVNVISQPAGFSASLLTVNPKMLIWRGAGEESLWCRGLEEDSHWMEDLAEVIGNRPLDKVVLPGTHDSGTATLSPNLGLSPDAPAVLSTLRQVFDVIDRVLREIGRIPLLAGLAAEILRLLGGWTWSRVLGEVVLPMSRAQSRTIADQLQAGIRYLDLRVGDRDGTLRICHTLFGGPIFQVIDDVRRFLDENPKEIVIIDLQHFYGVSPTRHTELAVRLVDGLGRERMVPSGTKPTVTPNTLWAGSGRVIVLHRERGQVPSEYRDLFWSHDSIVSKWANTASVDTLLGKLGHWLHDREQEPPTFWVLQGVLTVQALPEIPSPPSPVPPANPSEWRKFAEDWIGFLPKFVRALNDWSRGVTGLHALAEKANPAVLSRMSGDWANLNQNIAILDFYEVVDYVAAVKELNRRK